ncbi:MAG: tripartite tricarboxylate transporter permease, partial [Alphaproteobacteria bacterium]
AVVRAAGFVEARELPLVYRGAGLLALDDGAGNPGPSLFIDRPEVFWSVIISMYIGNVILLILNLPLIPYIARLLTIPSNLLVPLVLFFSLIGVYLVSFNPFDIQMMVAVAAMALVLRLFDYPMAPMILGFILGDLMERNLIRAIDVNDGSISFMWERPITAVILAITIVIVVLPLIGFFRERRRVVTAGEGG